MNSILKICLYGPESVGKTTLAQQLAEHFGEPFVPEVAREMLISNDFSMADMLAIGQAQTQRVQQLEAQAKRVIFCDTDLITTQIYAQLYLDEVAPRLYQYEAEISYDLYFLLDIDVPWVADGLRDLGHRRGEVLGVFEQALIQRQIDYMWVRGDWATRWQTVLDTLAERFGLFP